ncbi:carbohydrate sulfotransferase 1-like [Penaeus monodon]|uniref:carbohydrate sulfotransferase 1-like n=1 Tax=Penaeus monodon TaxID=6687 RepID=UPI0018A7D75A|nr:carbohydrate sulfotransferase 1-like [Penaeus monodon]
MSMISGRTLRTRWIKSVIVYCFIIYIFLTVDYTLFSRQKHHGQHHGATSRHHHKAQEAKRPHRHKPLRRTNVLVLSSMGRSGSSFLAEILASRGRNVYLVEPIRSLPQSQMVDEHSVREELKSCFRCDLRQEFLHFGDKPSSSVRHPYTAKKDFAGVDLEIIKGYCRQEPTRIVKTIRTRLAWVAELLQEDPSLKVVHLVRDPRGSLKSAAKVKWQLNPKETCSKIMEDLQTRQEMEKIYPNRYLFVKYEDLAQDAYKKTVEIYSFLRGKSVHLPKRVKKYLWKHSMNLHKAKKSFGTYRVSEKIYQHWRSSITEAELNTYEAACGDVIHALGHRIFGSEKRARDLSLSLVI